jgi:putative PEP-CTERM system TPR-repeat lipoprotein
VGIVLVLSLGPTPALSTTVDDDYVVSAQEFYDKGDIPAALIELKNALQANPDNPAARALLGKLYLDGGDLVGAEKELLRASKLGLNTEDLRLMLARVRLLQGDFRGALAATEQAPDPGSPLAQELIVRRGDALLGLGRTDEAIKSFYDALNVQPHAEAYAGLARASFASGHVDDALKFATRALEINPGNASLHGLIGALYWADGRIPEATKAMSRALELDSEDLDALVGMTKLKLLAKNYADAKEQVDQALRVGGNRASLVVLKAYTELALHNYVLARTLAEAVLADDSGNVTALYVSGAAGFALNETEQARRRLVQYLTRVPGDAHASAMLDYLNKVRHSLPDSSQAGEAESTDEVRSTLLGLLSAQALAVGAAQTGARALEIMAAQAGDNPRLSVQLSISKSQSGELLRAEDELALAKRLDKDGQFAAEIDQAETALILSHIRNRSFEKAIDLARAFVARRPEQATPYSLLSIAYAERGESAKALDAMQMARDKDPDAAELMGNYAALQARLGDTKGAIDTLKTSVAKHERYYPALLQLASLFFSAGDIDQAIHWAEKALDVNPNAVEPRVILARSYNAQRKYERRSWPPTGL